MGLWCFCQVKYVSFHISFLKLARLTDIIKHFVCKMSRRSYARNRFLREYDSHQSVIEAL